MDKSSYDHGYDIDGDIGTFDESIEHEEEMGVEIEEEVMPPREDFDAIVRRAENPICNTCPDDDDTNNVNTYGGL
eukprot:8787263-Ditylum_brightwellii.AAC.1